MNFADFLGCIQSVAVLGDNATSGNVRKMNPHMSQSQVKRMLTKLEGEGYVVSEKVDYCRTGKIVYHLSDKSIVNMVDVTEDMCKSTNFVVLQGVS